MIDYEVIEEQIKKKFGDSIFSCAENIKEVRQQIIRTTPRLDCVIGGGIPEGSFVVISGPPKGGKTSLSLKIGANAQNLGRKVYYVDIEARLKQRDIFQAHYINTDPKSFVHIKSTSEKILYGEEFIDIAEQLVNGVSKSIIILDSFSDICTRGEATADIADRYRADSPLLLARFCRRISQAIPINNNIVIGITHMIANQGTGYSKWSEASGQKVQYRADVKLKLTHFTPWVHSDKQQIGQEVHWECTTSSLSSPNGKTTSFLRYGYGIDEHKEYIELASDINIIKKKKSGWYEYNDKKYHFNELREHFIENNEEYKTEIVDKVDECFHLGQ